MINALNGRQLTKSNSVTSYCEVNRVSEEKRKRKYKDIADSLSEMTLRRYYSLHIEYVWIMSRPQGGHI